jgi:hypothetical protein
LPTLDDVWYPSSDSSAGKILRGEVLMVQKARCIHCRTDISVPDSYAHGDHIKCGTCGTQHKVQRGDVLRLVIADVAPLKDALRDNQQRVVSLESDLRAARASYGIGANGLGVAVAWVVYEVALKEAQITTGLLWKAAAIGVASGVFLEVCNYLFLAKRQAMTRISDEIADLKAEGRQLQQKIREAGRS